MPIVQSLTFNQENNILTQNIINVPYYYVDNNISDVDSSNNEGNHFNFTAQQYGPDSLFDNLTEDNMGQDSRIEDYVDNISDIDGSADLGLHSDFSAQQAGPDSVYDTLTEEDTGGDFSTFGKTDIGGTSWGYIGYLEASRYQCAEDCTVTQITLYLTGGAPGRYARVALYSDNSGVPDSLLGESNSQEISTDGWHVFNGFNVPVSANTDYWLAFQINTTNLEWRYDSGVVNQHAYRTYIYGPFPSFFGSPSFSAWEQSIYATSSSAANYELDLEVQWNDIVDFLPTEELCIYAGTFGSEDLRVDYWNGSDWANLATDLVANSWNNYTVSLPSTTFTVRFKGGIVTGDTTKNQWGIDAILLRSEGIGSKEDSVDNDTSDVDSSADKGSHTNFSAQQAGPDLIYDTLTEENTGNSSNSTLLDDGFEYFIWDANWNAVPSNWREDNFPVHSGSASAWATNFYEGYFTSDSLDASDATAIYVDFWFRKTGTDAYDFTLYYYDGSGYDLIEELGDDGFDNTWLHYTAKLTDNQYFVSNFRIRFDATLDFGEEAWVDDVLITKEIGGSDNYQLDVEVQWTHITPHLPNENLSIYCGIIDGEDLEVDVWNGTEWETVFVNLSSGWNNASITDWLTTSTFSIRFKGGTESGDATQTTWEIDVALIHIWSEDNSYELDLEVQWTNVDFSEVNEELCIYFDNGIGGSNNTHSFDVTGGYMLIGDGSPDWGSTTGTISFWVKFDTLANRPWGQHTNMETRISGSNIVLDWGGTGSLTSTTSFTPDKWYFIAVTWNEVTNDLILYVGDEDNVPTQDIANNAWISEVSTLDVTQNNFMNSRAGLYQVDGHGDELRYWNTDRSLVEIQGDYNSELTGSESNLRSYFKLNNNFDDIGPDNNDGLASGSYSFSIDTPFTALASEDLNVDVWIGVDWQNVIAGLNNGWNNATVTSYLISPTFTIRFKGGTETSDSIQDSWMIDVSLLHVWS